MDAVDEDGMSSPEDGGAAAGGLSELATIAGAENSIETTGGGLRFAIDHLAKNGST